MYPRSTAMRVGRQGAVAPPPPPPPPTHSVSISPSFTIAEGSGELVVNLAVSIQNQGGLTPTYYNWSGTGLFATLGSQAQFRQGPLSPGATYTTGAFVTVGFNNGSSRSASASIMWRREG